MRTIVVSLLAVAAAVLVARNAFVAAYAETNPQRAASLWPGHPAVAMNVGLAQIGEAAAAGQPITTDRIERLLGAARGAPLAPEPFMVRGVQLRLAGNEAAGGKAFIEARRRNPRLVPARFFLADHYLRTGRSEQGLEEVAALTRLLPGSEARLAPILAAYVLTPGAVPKVKAMLRSHPKLEPALLELLAGDARNAELVLSLASGRDIGTGNRPAWQVRLVEGLIDSGQYSRAYSVWSRLMGMSATAGRPLLFDPRFERTTALRPFGWNLRSSAAGLVEPDNGGLHILYYGRDAVSLASQTLLLAPGSYDLAMAVGKGDGAASLAWTVTCLPSKKVILTLDLATAAATPGRSHRFDVPGAGCAAQRLDLVGKPPEFPQAVDLSLSRLGLTRGGRQ